MTNELKPCPFCGVPESEDTVNFDHHADGCYLKMGLSNVVVTAANALIDTKLEPRFSTEQLYKAWNTRAERTVKVVEQVSTGYHLEDDEVRLSCGHIVNGRLPRTIPTYCDTCGAKVVK